MGRTVNGTTVTLTGDYGSGYAVGASYTVLTVASNGTVGGSGVHATSPVTVDNYGTIAAGGTNIGVRLHAGGAVLNSGTISGYAQGIGILGATGTVSNDSGTISASGYKTKGQGYAVYLANGGTILNSYGDIRGAYGFFTGLGAGIEVNGAAGTISNGAGTISGLTGIVLLAGGSIYNDGRISGLEGVVSKGDTTITNQSTIGGTTLVFAAIELSAGGTITNGTSALIGAVDYGMVSVGATTIVNLGRITAGLPTRDSNDGKSALNLAGTAQVTNGSASDNAALIQGYSAGIDMSGSLTLANFGSIDTSGGGSTSTGVYLDSGTVTNGSKADTTAFIAGEAQGLVASGRNATVTNFGTIRGSNAVPASIGVLLEGSAGNALTNGSLGDSVALVQGYAEGAVLVGTGSVGNYGTIRSPGTAGVRLEAGGTLTNGSAGGTAATIYGYGDGVEGAGAATTVANFGTILGKVGYGVVMTAYGGLVNGSADDQTALIEGERLAADLVGNVANFGTLLGVTRGGVNLDGTLINGSVGDTAALIEGYGQGAADLTGTVVNLGTVMARASYGEAVLLSSGGRLISGSGSDRLALVAGYSGVVALGAAGTVANWATIRGDGGTASAAVSLASGGTLTNGGLTDRTALVAGYFAAEFKTEAGTLLNFGTVDGTGKYSYAVVLGDGGSVVNGAGTETQALIEGAGGLVMAGAGSVVNFGTILGESGTAVQFLAAGDLLVDEAGAVFDGLVQGDGGTLELAAGAGTLGGLGTSFADFGQVTIAGGGQWLVTGSNSIASGETLTDGGSLTVSGSLANAGRIIGPVTLADGTLTNASGQTITSGGIAVLGVAGTLDSVSNAGTIRGGSTTGVGIELAGGGSITNGSASDTSALVAGATGVILNGPGTVTNYGTISGSRIIAGQFGTAVRFGSESDLLVVEAHAVFQGKVLGGGGTLQLAAGTGTLSGLGSGFSGFGLVTVDSSATWTLAGASSVAAGETLADQGSLTLGGTLGNAGTLVGPGALAVDRSTGGLVNAAGAVVDFTANSGIALAGTGTAPVIANAGLIEKTGGSGTAILALAVANAGTIAVSSGTLDLAGVIRDSGAFRGTLALAGTATLEAAAAVASGQTIQFTGQGETLELTAPASFAAAIAGFGMADTLDLRSLAPLAGESVSFTADKAGTGGTLTLTDGTRSFSVGLFGQYVSAGFAVGSDGHGGSAVTYLPPPPDRAPPLAAGA